MQLLTTDHISREYQEAVALCAADAGVPKDSLRILRVDTHYKSVQAYVATPAEAPAPSHVIKIQTQGWDPGREYEGLRFAAGAFAASDIPGPRRLGVVRALGYGLNPKFLATCYQPGRVVRSKFDEAIRRWRKPKARMEAARHARAIARWLLTFRSAGARATGGLTPEDYLAFCHDRIAEITRYLRGGDPTAVARACLERHLRSICLSDRERMACIYPQHGDLAPQNFLVDEDDAIYAFDLENFAHAPMDTDLAWFRIRLERYALWAPFARAKATSLWQEFWNVYTQCGNSQPFGLWSYLHTLLAHLAWVKNPENPGTPGLNRRFTTRARDHLWIRSRLRWLGRLSGDTTSDCNYFRHEL